MSDEDPPAPIEQVCDPSSQRSFEVPEWFANNAEFDLRYATRVQPLVCGEDAFAAVSRALNGAQHSINMCFWGLDPAMLLKRGTAENWDNTEILGEILLRKAIDEGVTIRMIVWDHYFESIGSMGIGSSETDPTNQDTGGNSRNLERFRSFTSNIPNIDVRMTNALSTIRWTYFPSFHQKSIIVDIENPPASTAFVMGHNMLVSYWSKQSLRKYDNNRQFYLQNNREIDADDFASDVRRARETYEFYRDMTGYVPPNHAATVERFRQQYDALRNATAQNRFSYTTHRAPHLKPYLDVSSQIWGKAVTDVYDNFSRVWKENAGSAPPAHPPVSQFQASGHTAPAQVAATFPLTQAKDIEKLYRHAMQNADRYILMVNQYFRNWPLTDEIIDWWAQHRDIPCRKKVPLMIVTNDWNLPENIDTLGFMDRASARAQAGHDGVTRDKFLAAEAPISLTKMLTEEQGDHSTIYVHAKLLLVDDVCYSIGSANYNRRGMESDPELNIGVLDGQEALRLRREVMNILVGDPMNDLGAGNDPMDAFARWQSMVTANTNASASSARLPHGRVVSYSATTRDPNDETGNRRADASTGGGSTIA
ncbi:MAG: phospholipase D-like domain-containing protein [Pseudomonadota bacterium]